VLKSGDEELDQMKLRVALAALLFSSVVAAQDNTTVLRPENIAPTTPCEGLTGALPEAIAECQKRETARLFMILGKQDAALRVLCSTKAAKDAFANAGLDCVKETNAREK
jgi:hypothetical protein